MHSRTTTWLRIDSIVSSLTRHFLTVRANFVVCYLYFRGPARGRSQNVRRRQARDLRIALWLVLHDQSWSTRTADLASGANMLSSPTSRAHSYDLEECSRKGCLVSEPGLDSHCTEWLSRFNEQLHREFDTPLNKPSVARDSKACLECTREVSDGQ